MAMKLVMIYNGSELNVDSIIRLEPMAVVPNSTIAPLYSDEALKKIENEKPIGCMPARGSSGNTVIYKPIVAYNVVMSDGHEEVVTIQDYLEIKALINRPAGRSV
jgi:hypothetical protein